MAGAHRRYTFTSEQPWPEGSGPKIAAVLERECERRWWFRDAQVDEAVPAFAISVSANDQWAVHRRAMKLAELCYLAARIPRGQVPVPVWEDTAAPVPSETGAAVGDDEEKGGTVSRP